MIRGAQPLLVVLVEFSDVHGSTTPPSWESLTFGTSASVADYYDQVSYGNLSMVPAAESSGVSDGVVGWLNLGYPHPDLSQSGTGQVFQDAIAASDPYVDFSVFDTNGDRYLVSDELRVVVVVAGGEAATGCPEPSTWARGGIAGVSTSDAVTGQVGSVVMGELQCTGGTHQATLGTPAHELGHTLGLPDLYDYDLSSTGGVGMWSLMSYGLWNSVPGDLIGETPALLDAWSKSVLGWVVPHVVQGNEPGREVTAVETNPDVVQILHNPNGAEFAWGSPGVGEYFLVENRQKIGYDAALPGSGLLVWHIDESMGGNTNDTHRLVDLEEADNDESYGEAGDPFVATSTPGLFDDTTLPNANLYGGQPGWVTVRVLTPSHPTMRADFEDATPPGGISGTVTGWQSAPVPGIDVWIFDLGGTPARSATTDSSGAYSATGLVDGDYKVRFADASGRHLEEWFDDSPTMADAGTVSVVGGANASGIDAALSVNVVRLSGMSRFGTAVSVSETMFPSGASTVYVANGSGFADALAGGVAAALAPGPVLLVRSGSIPVETAAELARLAPSEIVILGGTGAVSSPVESTLGGYASSVRRLWGADRFATAVAVATDAFASGAPVAVLANGLNYPDGLAGVPAAARLGGPLLLTRSSVLPQVTADAIVALGASRVVILGGTGAVSSSVEAAVGALAGVTTVERWSGSSRFATAAAISQEAFPWGTDVVYVAHGLNFPDALAGAPAAFLGGGPLLLVRTDSIPAETSAEILRSWTSRIVILGGTGVVSDAVASQLEALIGVWGP